MLREKVERCRGSVRPRFGYIKRAASGSVCDCLWVFACAISAICCCVATNACLVDATAARNAANSVFVVRVRVVRQMDFRERLVDFLDVVVPSNRVCRSVVRVVYISSS